MVVHPAAASWPGGRDAANAISNVVPSLVAHRGTCNQVLTCFPCEVVSVDQQVGAACTSVLHGLIPACKTTPAGLQPCAPPCCTSCPNHSLCRRPCL